jgi:hypothetical protein
VEDFCKRNFSFTAQAAIQQVFPRCQPGIQWCQLAIL